MVKSRISSNQKVMILSIVIVFLLAVSTSCAADNTTETMDNTEDVAGVKYTDSISKNPKTFSDLYTKINNATGSEIYLDDDYIFNNDSDSGLKNGIYIKRAMTIYGNGSTIDAGGNARIFLVYDNIGSVVFKDIVFVNGKNMYEGGAIKGKATVIDCIFKNNHANDGGAIYGETTAINCIFTNNSANWGAATHGCSCITAVSTTITPLLVALPLTEIISTVALKTIGLKLMAVQHMYQAVHLKTAVLKIILHLTAVQSMGQKPLL